MPDRHVDPDKPDITVRLSEYVGLYLHIHLGLNLVIHNTNSDQEFHHHHHAANIVWPPVGPFRSHIPEVSLIVSPGSSAFWPVVFSILGILSKDNLSTHRNQFFLYSCILYTIVAMFSPFANT